MNEKCFGNFQLFGIEKFSCLRKLGKLNPSYSSLLIWFDFRSQFMLVSFLWFYILSCRESFMIFHFDIKNITKNNRWARFSYHKKAKKKTAEISRKKTKQQKNK